MAIGGRATLNIDTTKITQGLELLINKVERGTRKATLAAVEEIYDRSLEQVPRDTGTLASSAYYRVAGGYRTGFTGIVGYGGNGDPINPKTGEPASNYMLAVHEDMSANHPVGKAKFLEDAVLEYQRDTLGKYATFIRQETGM